jgi:hypothetical protein
MLVRRILDDFCRDHRLALSDARAIEAARYLLSLAMAEWDAPQTMRRSLEDWHLVNHPGVLTSGSTVAKHGLGTG